MLQSTALVQLYSPSCGDEWRMGFVGLLTNVAHVTASQAARLLRSFIYRKVWRIQALLPVQYVCVRKTLLLMLACIAIHTAQVQQVCYL